MHKVIKRFWQWLFPDHYSEIAECGHCGEHLHKMRMVRDSVYGWYCCEEHLKSSWWERQL